ncbi:hypothetical protein [Agrococcus sediminis]|uniref:hypothetical protein n=1 Tax=Agrococcus sediminis TaxID=2599924 RepID=UPI0034482F96
MADSNIRDGGDQPLDDEQPLPTGGEPPAPAPNADRDGQADFAAEATGERYERVVQEGLDRIDEHRERIAELEAEQPGGSPEEPGEPLQPGPGAPEAPGAPGTPDVPGAPAGPGGPDAPVPGAPGAPEAPQGPGTLDPTAPVGDPAGDASALDDTDRAQP